MGILVVQNRNAQLLEVVDALRPPGGLPGSLYCGQQQADQDTNDRDHHQQFNEGETTRRGLQEGRYQPRATRGLVAIVRKFFPVRSNRLTTGQFHAAAP